AHAGFGEVESKRSDRDAFAKIETHRAPHPTISQVLTKGPTTTMPTATHTLVEARSCYVQTGTTETRRNRSVQRRRGYLPERHGRGAPSVQRRIHLDAGSPGPSLLLLPVGPRRRHSSAQPAVFAGQRLSCEIRPSRMCRV